MLRGLYGAVSGAEAFQNMNQIAATDAANMNTPGFEAEAPAFSTFMVDPVTNAATGATIGSFAYGVQQATVKDLTISGQILQTGRALDVAPAQNVWISVNTPTGTQYTRDGQLHVDAKGNLVTAAGYQVQGRAGGPIRVGTELGAAISSTGVVTVGGKRVGQLALATATAGAGAMAPSTDQGLYTAGTATRLAVGGNVVGGALVGSNVTETEVAAALTEAMNGYATNETAAHTIATNFMNFLQTAVR